MYKKTINHPSGAVTYTIYTKEEADYLGIKYKKWYKAKKGEYALSDDGMVAKVISTKMYRAYYGKKPYRRNKFVKTPYGQYFFKIGRKTSAFYAKDREHIHNVFPKKELRGNKRKRAIAIVREYIKTRDIDYAIRKLLKEHPDWNYRNWYKWSKTEECNKMITEELSKMLEEQGLGVEKTLQLLKDAIEKAKGERTTNNLIKLLETLLRMHNIQEPQKKLTKSDEKGERVLRYLSDAQSEVEMLEIREPSEQPKKDIIDAESEVHDE